MAFCGPAAANRVDMAAPRCAATCRRQRLSRSRRAALPLPFYAVPPRRAATRAAAREIRNFILGARPPQWPPHARRREHVGGFEGATVQLSIGSTDAEVE